MKRLAVVVVAAAVLVSGVHAQDPARLFKAAMNTEMVDGDLRAAIEQYKKVADGSDRALAAQALLRMAECYQKLGDPQARTVYERIAREFADQPAASAARARLGFQSPTSPTGMLNRKVWSGSGVDAFGTVSPDGRHLSFVDWETGDLALRELATGTNRRLTNKGSWTDSGDFAQESVISPDGMSVVYAWFADDLGRYQLRMLRTDRPANQPPIMLVDNPEIQYIAPYSWSPNGTVAVQIRRVDRTAQLALFNANDRSMKVLRSIDWRGTSKAFLSPDGRFLAYDLPVGGDAAAQRDVHVIATDGSTDSPVVVHEANDDVVGWSPAGTHILFTRDGRGSEGLWSLPLKEGKPTGPAEVVTTGVTPFSLGITQSGALVYALQIGAMQVFTATVDFSRGRFTSQPRPAREGYRFPQRGPAWSADGRSLVYIARNVPDRLAILSLDTGHLQDKQLQLDAFGQLRSISGDWMVCNCTDLKGRQGIYRLNAATGEAVPVLLTEGDRYLFFPSMSRDGQWVAYSRARTTTAGRTADIIVRNVTTGDERQLASDGLMPVISPSGRHVAYVSRQQLHVVPLAGGQPRVLAPADGSQALVQWTPDERFIVTHQTSGEAHVAGVVPLDGGAPTTVHMPSDWSPMMFSIHPDGRQIAFSAGQGVSEVWMLENFLPKATK